MVNEFARHGILKKLHLIGMDVRKMEISYFICQQSFSNVIDIE